MAADLANQVYNSTTDVTQYALDTLKATSATIVEDCSTSTTALVAASDDAVMVVYKGTEESEDFTIDETVALVPVTFGNAGVGNVHSGFDTAVNSVYSQVSTCNGALLR